MVVTLCALLLKTKRAWLFSAPLLPLAARLCCLPLQALPLVNTFATTLTILQVLYVAASSLATSFHLVAAAFREVTQVSVGAKRRIRRKRPTKVGQSGFVPSVLCLECHAFSVF